MRGSSSRIIIGVIIMCVVWIMVTVLTAMLLSGCVRPIQTKKSEQIERAVTIQVNCLTTSGWGSGTVISEREILTAKHVVDRCRFPFMMGVLSNGDTLVLKVRAVSKYRDAAILVSSEDMLYKPVRMGRVSVGDKVCAAPTQPYRIHTCGRVLQLFEEMHGFNVHFDMTVIPGNSGAGIYNEAGELVGIVTHSAGNGGGMGTAVWLVREELGI